MNQTNLDLTPLIPKILAYLLAATAIGAVAGAWINGITEDEGAAMIGGIGAALLVLLAGFAVSSPENYAQY